jgi:VPS inhibitor protein E
MPLKQTQDHTNFYALNYLAAKTELEKLLEKEPLNSSKKQHAQKIINQIERLKNDGKLPIPDSTELLNDTKALLNHSMAPEAYRAKAQNLQGNPSMGLKILGALMIALGTIVTALCITLTTVIGITLSGEGVIGAGILAAGIGIFSGGMRSGLSKAMNELADSAKENAP